MTKFQWDTEEDHNWQEIEEISSPQRSWQKLLLPLLIVLLLLGGGYAIYDRISDTVGSVTTQTEAEVEATVQLLYESAAAGDMELFRTMLSASDREWSSAQQQMMAGNGLLDRSAFGLTLLDEVPQVIGIELNPELNSAEITTTIHYQTALSETVQFNLPLVVRKGSSHWLYASPTKGDAKNEDDLFIASQADYWGGFVEQREMFFFKASYFERDEKLVRRLISDMNDGIEKLCQENPTLCRNSFPTFETQFQPDPNLLARDETNNDVISDSELALYRSSEQAGFHAPFSLPTPSLIGLPTDDASYKALLYGYAQQIITPALIQLSEYECCLHHLYAHALVERMLIDTGLKGEVLSAEDYEHILFNYDYDYESPIGWTVNKSQPNSLAEQRRFAAIQAQFLLSQYPLDPALALSNLGEQRAFDDWLAASLGDDVIKQLQEEAGWPDDDGNPLNRLLFENFTPFLVGASGLQQPRSALPPALDYPTATVGLSCNDTTSGQFINWEVATNSFETVYAPEDGFIGWAGEEKATDGVLLLQYPQSYEDSAGQNRIVLLGQDGPQVIRKGDYVQANGFFGFAPAVDLNNSFIDFRSPNRDVIQFDLSQCENGDCPFTQYDGLPILSPNGDRTLVIRWEGPPSITIFDADGELIFERIGYSARGRQNFWLSNDEIAVIPNSGDSLEALNVVTGEGRTVLESDMFEAAIATSGEEVLSRLNFDYRLNERDSAEIFVNVSQQTASFGQWFHSFIYNLESETITLELPRRHISMASPDNRSLSVRLVDENQQWQQSVVSRTSGREFSLPTVGYTQNQWLDEEWLLFTSFLYTMLIAPNYDYFELVTPPDDMQCTSAMVYR